MSLEEGKGCQNGEEKEIPMPVIFDDRKCCGCCQCAFLCPSLALEIREGRPVLSVPQACTLCGTCGENCLAGAITFPAGQAKPAGGTGSLSGGA